MNKAIKDEGLRLGKMKATLVANSAALRALRNVPGVSYAYGNFWQCHTQTKMN